MVKWRVKHGWSDRGLTMTKEVSFDFAGNPELLCRTYAELVNTGQMDAPGTRSWDAVVERQEIGAWTRA